MLGFHVSSSYVKAVNKWTTAKYFQLLTNIFLLQQERLRRKASWCQSQTRRTRSSIPRAGSCILQTPQITALPFSSHPVFAMKFQKSSLHLFFLLSILLGSKTAKLQSVWCALNTKHLGCALRDGTGKDCNHTARWLHPSSHFPPGQGVPRRTRHHPMATLHKN